MTEVLRQDPGSFGLVTGVGMHMTSHRAALWSTRPGPSDPVTVRPPRRRATVPLATEAEGPARIAAYSTVYSREGPEWTALICDLPDGSRSYARLDQPAPDDVDLAGGTVTLAHRRSGGVTHHRCYERDDMSVTGAPPIIIEDRDRAVGPIQRRGAPTADAPGGGGRHVRTEDLILVSVDDHVIEPPGMFDGLLPARYQDKGPHPGPSDDGTDFWHYNGSEIPNVGLNAVVGRPPDEYGIEPSSLAEMRLGCYDIHERVRDMSANGVLGSMCFPRSPSSAGSCSPAGRPPTPARPWP
jgi:hypothetical protein